MRPGGRLWLALAAPGLALALWLAGLALLIRAATGGGGVAVAPYAAGTIAAITFGWWVAGLIAGAYAVRALWRRHVLAPARLLNAARIAATDRRAGQAAAEALTAALPDDAPLMLRALAAEFAAMTETRARLTADMARLVDEASRNVAEQRDQLAALMAELDHAVVVCNMDGRILLYNERARMLARRLAPVWTGKLVGAAEAGAASGADRGDGAPDGTAGSGAAGAWARSGIAAGSEVSVGGGAPGGTAANASATEQDAAVTWRDAAEPSGATVPSAGNAVEAAAREAIPPSGTSQNTSAWASGADTASSQRGAAELSRATDASATLAGNAAGTAAADGKTVLSDAGKETAANAPQRVAASARPSVTALSGTSAGRSLAGEASVASSSHAASSAAPFSAAVSSDASSSAQSPPAAPSSGASSSPPSAPSPDVSAPPAATAPPRPEPASSVPNTGGGVGLGRSIYGILDRAAVAHALETVASRLARGVGAQGAAAQFVTTAESGQLLQVSLAPVRAAEALSADGQPGNAHPADPRPADLRAPEPGATPPRTPPARPTAPMTGFVLLLHDITRDHAAQSTRDTALREMTETARASVASLQAALEMLELPDLSIPDRDRFMAVLRDEVAAMGARLGDAVGPDTAPWPLQDMLGSDLMAAALRRLGTATGAPVASFPVAEDLWLRIDSFGLLQALEFLAARLSALQRDPDLWLRLAQAGGRAHLDLGWRARPGDPPAAAAALTQMQSDPMPGGVSVRELMDRHGGEIWLERDRDAGTDQGAFFRLLLPLAAVESEGPAAITGARPEFYDFDLFAAPQASAADDQPLAALTFTVFDCETTGLDPSGGDEIIQIGAVRIVNSRILRGETIDQLVDPRRSIPEAGIPIHHIHPQMLRGQPTIRQALPAFCRFAEGSVLVGHNVAFDMRFLKLKEAATGCVFDHPVLDTLLLSSIVHPAEDSHSLEAIAARLGITIGARHTALGDALATAEVFARLIPLLARQGVVTLGQARAAAGRSQFARLRY